MSAAALAEARLWVGTPYVHQACCRGAGADCLGLIRGVWRAVRGEEPAIPPYGFDGQEALLMTSLQRLLVPKPLAGLGEGDVLLFRMRASARHLGIMSQEGAFLHAYSGHGVLESHLTPAWRRRLVAGFGWG